MLFKVINVMHALAILSFPVESKETFATDLCTKKYKEEDNDLGSRKQCIKMYLYEKV
jgi:hypothetical protein